MWQKSKPFYLSGHCLNPIRLRWLTFFIYILFHTGISGAEEIPSWNDTLHLSLDDCIKIALGKSPSVQTARWDSLASAGEHLSVRAERYPQLRLYGDVPSLSERVDYDIITDTSGSDIYSRVSFGDRRWQSRVELEQALPWGATMYLSTMFYKSVLYNSRVDAGREISEYSLMRSISINQPILAGNPIGRKQKISNLNWRRALIGHEMTMRQIRFRATRLFFELVSATEALEIAQHDLDQGRTTEDLAKRKLQAGLIPEVELLQIQVDLARREASYRGAIDAVEAATDRLLAELGLPLDQCVETYWSPGDVSADDVGEVDSSGERLELISEKLNLERQELNTRAAILRERINASIELFYELDIRHDEVDLFSRPAERNIGAVLHFEFPLFGFGSTKGKIEQLRADQARTRIDYAIREVELVIESREALRMVERAAERIKIADAALDLSQRSYEISAERFEAGQIDSRQLLDSQLDLTRTSSELLSARIDYELALANLERIALPQVK